MSSFLVFGVRGDDNRCLTKIGKLLYRAAGGERRVSSDIERRVSDTERKASDVERRVSDIRKSTKVQNPRRMCGLP